MTNAPRLVTRPRDGGAGNRALTRRFRRLRVEAVLTAPGTAILGELRYEGRFQIGLADTSRRRLAQIRAQEQTARDPHLRR
nr:hypothetical protein [Hyphomonas sp.]